MEQQVAALKSVAALQQFQEPSRIVLEATRRLGLQEAAGLETFQKRGILVRMENQLAPVGGILVKMENQLALVAGQMKAGIQLALWEGVLGLES